MLLMNYDIQIGAYKLNGIDSVVIESSVNALSDKCTITLPGAVFNKPWNIEEKLKRGDKVVVKLGYNGNLHTEFTGYLRSIHPNLPMKLECEDAAFLLRKPVKDKHWKDTTVIDILNYIVSEVNKSLTEKIKLVTDLKGIQYDKFHIVHSNGLQALDKIREDFGIALYCRAGKGGSPELHCHLSYTEKRGDAAYDVEKNVEESDELQYVKKEEVKIRAKVIGRSNNGKTIEVEVGDKGGDLRTFQLPNVSSKASLEKAGLEKLKKLTYDGYKGAIRGWLEPVVEIGYHAKLIDREYPDRQGTYFVNSVKTEFSKNGGIRTVGLGVKVS